MPTRTGRHAEAARLHDPGATCCHPALNTAAQVELTLRLLGGLSTAEIAHAFLGGHKARHLTRFAGGCTRWPGRCRRTDYLSWPRRTANSSRTV